MNITITEKDLTQGVINSPTSDPITLALMRAGFVAPRVGLHRFSADVGGKRAFFELSPSLKAFRRNLTYRDRHEILKAKRNKKGDIVRSEPLTFPLGMTPPQVLPIAA